jgi:AcrR family transcriptional regulator
VAVRARTEARLLDAADELFFVHGAVATPVDAVLERAGVSPATLYRAYGSKEGLIAAALERRQRSWLDAWDDAIAQAPDDRARLLAVFDALDHFRDKPAGARWCAFLGTAAEYAEPSPVLAAAIRRDTDDLRTRLTALAQPVAGSDAVTLAEALLLVVSGDLAMRLRVGSPADTRTARTVAEAVVDRWTDRERAHAS